jgi:hypothetical protein
MENKNTNQQKTSIPSQMNEYRGKFVTFLYANNWKIDEDEQYGMITITNFDSNDRPEFAYSLVRTKFERDSKNSKSFF